jgi:hypothetical protein
MRGSTRGGTLALGFAALAACAADAPPASPAAAAEVSPTPVATSLAAVTEAALADAARRSGLEEDALKVLSAEAVTWSDGSLGCPQPGMMYTQALVPGYRVRIKAGGQVLDYHAGRSGKPTMCPAERSVEPISEGASRA